MSAVLLPKVFATNLVKLGYLTKNPLRPNFLPFKPSDKLQAQMDLLLSPPNPELNKGIYIGVEKRGWFAIQLLKFLGTETAARSGTLFVVEGGETTTQTFSDITEAFQQVLADEKAKKWINDVSRYTTKAYFVTTLVQISDATVTRGRVKSLGTSSYIDIPLDKLSQASLELKAGFKLEDFGLSSGVVNGIVGIGYDEVKLRTRPLGTQANLTDSVSWIRPPLVQKFIGGEEEVILEASLAGAPEVEELKFLAQSEQKLEDQQ
jgi:hypothetical protein